MYGVTDWGLAIDAWVSDLQAAGRTWVSLYPSRDSVDPFRFYGGSDIFRRRSRRVNFER